MGYGYCYRWVEAARRTILCDTVSATQCVRSVSLYVYVDVRQLNNRAVEVSFKD